MNEVKTVTEGDGFSHATVGNIHGFEGKKFVKDATGASSCEISFGTLPSGAGRFQVDDQVFDVAEGSVVRIATGCDRNLRCTSGEPMTYICIQALENSLGAYTMTDAEITERPILL